jgi:hypothetical protein
MATISNKTNRPLRVPLPQGQVLHLGPRMRGEIAPGAVKHPAIVALVEAGTIEIVSEGPSETQRGQDGGRLGGAGRHARSSGAGGHRSGDR